MTAALGSVVIHLDSDWSEIDAEVDHLSRMPDGEMIESLDKALQAQADLIRGTIHVITGSLKGSVHVSSKSNSETHTWEGEIVVGGESTGPKDPVNYAIYEKARGGTHDFIAPAVAAADPSYTTAIAEGFLF